MNFLPTSKRNFLQIKMHEGDCIRIQEKFSPHSRRRNSTHFESNFHIFWKYFLSNPGKNHFLWKLNLEFREIYHQIPRDKLDSNFGKIKWMSRFGKIFSFWKMFFERFLREMSDENLYAFEVLSKLQKELSSNEGCIS